jgi:hypothetical protein
VRVWRLSGQVYVVVVGGVDVARRRLVRSGRHVLDPQLRRVSWEARASVRGTDVCSRRVVRWPSSMNGLRARGRCE